MSLEEKLARNIKEKAEILEQKAREDKAERQRLALNRKREEAKLQTQRDHDEYKRERQRQREQKEHGKTAEEEAREQIRTWKTMGFSDAEIEYKKLNVKEVTEYNNMLNQGECKDIYDYLRIKKRERLESEQRRRKLKGL